MSARVHALGGARCSLALLALLALAPGGCRSPRPEPPQKIVVIVIDTLRADRLGLFGRRVDPLPVTTELAARGVFFERAWAPSSWTAPSTASIFTGVYPSQHGVELGVWLYGAEREANPTLRLHRIPAALDTLPEVMRAAGYRTFGVADNVNIGEREGFDAGFDRFAGFDYAGAPRVNEVLASWSEEIRGAPKRFVYLHFMDPHEPYHRRKAFLEPAEEPGPRGEVLARYDSELRFLDRQMRRALELIAFDDETALILAADHGEAFYDRGDAVGHGFQLYSELTHVPLLVVDPERERGQARVAANVSLVDILPTVREWVGLDAAPQLAGRSLLPLYTGAADSGEGSELAARPIFGSRLHVAARGGGRKRSVVRGDLKWIETRSPSGARTGQELYDLRLDPGERRNLALSRPRELAELRSVWERNEAAAPRWEPEPAERHELSVEAIERLRALGYTDESAP